MEEDVLNKDVWYAGVEPVEVGNLDDIKEIKTVIPPTKGVRVKIVKVNNLINKDNTYRQIALGLKLTQGIDGKYKGMFVNAKVCYYADPNVYTKDYFKTKQYLIQLKLLSKATGIDLSKIDGYKLDELLNAPEIKVDIVQKKGKKLVDDEVGGKVEEETIDNEARNFTTLPIEELI